MTRFQLYLLILAFGIFILLLQIGIHSPWTSKEIEQNSLRINRDAEFFNQGAGSPNSWSKFISGDVNQLEKKQIWPIKLTIHGLTNKTFTFGNSNNVKVAEDQPSPILPPPFPWSYDRLMLNVSKLMFSNNNKYSGEELRSLLNVAFNPLNVIPVVDTNYENVTRILIITYFRSGSTFLGDLLQQNWKSFYHFEPLHYLTDGMRVGDDHLEESLDLIEKLFRCDFPNAKSYLSWASKAKNQFLFKWNTFLWSVCRYRPSSCFDANFVKETCIRSPVHIMKVARLHMRHVQKLIQRVKDLDIKVVYLVRDPRGIYNSRKSLKWCNQTVCGDILNLCNEMKEDFTIFKSLAKEKGENFLFLRYEDLSLRPGNESRTLFKELGIPFSASVRRYLKTHTNARIPPGNNRNPYSTRRNSSSIPFEWKHKLLPTEISKIEDSCSQIIEELGYNLQIKNNTDQTDADLVIEKS